MGRKKHLRVKIFRNQLPNTTSGNGSYQIRRDFHLGMEDFDGDDS